MGDISHDVTVKNGDVSNLDNYVDTHITWLTLVRGGDINITVTVTVIHGFTNCMWRAAPFIKIKPTSLFIYPLDIVVSNYHAP